MATVNPTVTAQGDDAVLIEWTLTNANADGAPVGPAYASYPDRSVQVSGTFGGATIVWEGSNIGASPSYVTLTDPQGNAISKAAAAIEQIMEHCLWERPSLSAGAGSSVVVSLFCRRNPLSRS